MNMENWRDVEGYEGIYQVSDLGNVRSLDRGNRKGRVLKASVNGWGYLMVGLSKEGKLKSFTIHKLVAMAFLGHAPCGLKEVVDHINNDPLDNRVVNLQLTTHRHNLSKDKNNCSSEYIGVYWEKGRKKWRAQIHINGKKKYLGLFEDELEAHQAYQKALSNV